MKTLPEKLEFLGFILAAVGWLILLAQLGGRWRFGSFDPWFSRILLHGSVEQVGALAYLVLVLVLLSCRRA